LSYVVFTVGGAIGATLLILEIVTGDPSVIFVGLVALFTVFIGLMLRHRADPAFDKIDEDE
jgi:hypothetical protein